MNWKSFAAVAASFLALAPASALADMAPSIAVLGTTGPDQQSPVSMDTEIVTFTVSKDFSSGDFDENAGNGGSVKGEAKFEMKNPTDRAVDVESVFPTSMSGDGNDGKEYAKNVKVSIDGKPVAATYKTDAAYPKWDGSNFKATGSPGYVFSFSMPPGAHQQVVIGFDVPSTGYEGWNYLLSSGAGWTGPINKATVRVVYPYALRPEWVTINGIKPKVSGTIATSEYVALEPTVKNDLMFEVLRPAFADAILKAEKKTADNPSVAQGWLELAEANKAVVYYHATVPQWSRDAYWKAIATYLDRKYSTHSAPTKVVAATEIAEVYTDHWANPCDGAGCRTWEDTEAANALLRHISTVMLPASNTTDHDALVMLSGKLETWLKSFGVEVKAGEPVPATTKPMYAIQDNLNDTADSANPWVLMGLAFGLGILAALVIHAIMTASRKK